MIILFYDCEISIFINLNNVLRISFPYHVFTCVFGPHRRGCFSLIAHTPVTVTPGLGNNLYVEGDSFRGVFRLCAAVTQHTAPCRRGGVFLPAGVKSGVICYGIIVKIPSDGCFPVEEPAQEAKALRLGGLGRGDAFPALHGDSLRRFAVAVGVKADGEADGGRRLVVRILRGRSLLSRGLARLRRRGALGGFILAAALVLAALVLVCSGQLARSGG